MHSVCKNSCHFLRLVQFGVRSFGVWYYLTYCLAVLRLTVFCLSVFGHSVFGHSVLGLLAFGHLMFGHLTFSLSTFSRWIEWIDTNTINHYYPLCWILIISIHHYKIFMYFCLTVSIIDKKKSSLNWWPSIYLQNSEEIIIIFLMLKIFLFLDELPKVFFWQFT